MSEPTEPDPLAKALADLQAHCGGVKKTGRNPHFKSAFTTLADAWAVVRPALPGLGLAIVQVPVYDAETGHAGVRTLVRHVSGQSLDCGALLLPLGKRDAQGVGSAITYARRYALLAVCGVADDDDDGHAASQPAPQSRSKAAQRTTLPRSDSLPTPPPANAPAPPEAVAVAEAMTRLGQSAEAARWLGWARSNAGTDMWANGLAHATELLKEFCGGHQHTETSPAGPVCLGCGYVLPEEGEPEEAEPAEVVEQGGVA